MRVLADAKDLCDDAIGGLACRHLPSVPALAQAHGNAINLLVAFLLALVTRRRSCRACCRALQRTVTSLAQHMDGRCPTLPFSWDPLKQELRLVAGQKRKRHDEDFRRKLSQDVLVGRTCTSNMGMARVQGADKTSVGRWQEQRLRAQQHAMHRVYGAPGPATYHLAEDGKRLGRPAKETEHYSLARCCPVGSSQASFLPPQAPKA